MAWISRACATAGHVPQLSDLDLSRDCPNGSSVQDTNTKRSSNNLVVDGTSPAHNLGELCLHRWVVGVTGSRLITRD